MPEGVMHGRVVLITGAGGGIGRAEAIGFAREGARVLINDVPGARPAVESLISEIEAAGGEAAAFYGSVADFPTAAGMVDAAIERFGALDVVINNAGILRDRMLVSMSEQEWDDVIAVHLKGTFAVSRHAAAHWRERTKAGDEVHARIINTTSASGIYGQTGQSNYGAAKAGIAAMTIILAGELERYGVTVNAIAPMALTPMNEHLRERTEEEKRLMAPENIVPLVVWLGSTASDAVTGRVFNVRGYAISVAEGWVAGPSVERDRLWRQDELSSFIPDLVAEARGQSDMFGRTLTR